VRESKAKEGKWTGKGVKSGPAKEREGTAEKSAQTNRIRAQQLRGKRQKFGGYASGKTKGEDGNKKVSHGDQPSVGGGRQQPKVLRTNSTGKSGKTSRRKPAENGNLEPLKSVRRTDSTPGKKCNSQRDSRKKKNQ